jgi:hypothetical protein
MRGFLQNTASSFLGENGPPPTVFANLLGKDEITVRSAVMGGQETIASLFAKIGLPGKLSEQSILDWIPKPNLPGDEEMFGLGAWMTDLSVAIGSDATQAFDREIEARL